MGGDRETASNANVKKKQQGDETSLYKPYATLFIISVHS